MRKHTYFKSSFYKLFETKLFTRLSFKMEGTPRTKTRFHMKKTDLRRTAIDGSFHLLFLQTAS